MRKKGSKMKRLMEEDEILFTLSRKFSSKKKCCQKHRQAVYFCQISVVARLFFGHPVITLLFCHLSSHS